MHGIGKTLIGIGIIAAVATTALIGANVTAQRGNDTDKDITLVALGDSMTIASNSCGDTDTCPGTSWASGTDKTVHSLATRLHTATKKHVTVQNYAHIGDKASALENQIPKAVAARADIVTILMGANDICAANDPTGMTSVTDYRSIMHQAIDTLHTQLPDTRIVLASVPDPTKLWQALHADPAAVNKWGYQVCVVALRPGDDQNADNRRAAVTQRVNAYNKVLRAIAMNNSDFVHFDNGAVNNFDYSAAIISKVDYLHPNTAGQAQLAERVWRAPGMRSFLTR